MVIYSDGRESSIGRNPVASISAGGLRRDGGQKRVGIVRYKGRVAGVWTAVLEGWTWFVTPEMKILVLFGSKETSRKAFRTRGEGEQALETAWNSLRIKQ